jgi:enolase
VGVALTIERVLAWEALDSRGTPTVASVVRLAVGAEGEAVVPSGASTGTHEAHERRDGGERYGGRGVRGAVAAVSGEIAAAVVGRDASDQEMLDAALRELDGTGDLSRLGANAVLAVSVAAARASAAAHGVPLWRSLQPVGEPLLPLPMVNVVSGGAHAGRLVDVQDVLVVPLGASSFTEAIEWAWRVRAASAAELERRGHDASLVSDEGGLAAPLASNRDAVELVAAGIERSGLVPGVDAAIAVDVAATQLLDGGAYVLAREARRLSALELVDEIAGWAETLPIVSVEDVLAEDDPAWPEATRRLAALQVLGDDLFATSAARIADGAARGAANAVLVKPNQVGTVSDTRRAVEAAWAAGYATVLSARSGETEDAWLADLAVGWRAGQIKVGSTTRSERTAKWNRLLRIEAEATDPLFAGRQALAGPHRTD